MNKNRTAPRKKVCVKYFAAGFVIMLVAFLLRGQLSSGETVEIIRDKYGIPHIFAKSRAGAYYGAGWVEAEDRAPLLLSSIIRARGRSSELLKTKTDGPDRFLMDTDVMSLALDYYGFAAEWNQLPEDIREVLVAYADGFNDYIKALKKKGQLESRYGGSIGNDFARIVSEFGEITPRDLVAFAIMRNTRESMSNLTQYEKEKFRIAVMTGAGSNAVAISPDLTQDGHAILYGDLHLDWSGSNHMVHLSAPGFELFGMFTGPFAMGGRTNGMSFAHTRNNPDGADVYIEKISTDGSAQYRYDDQWHPLEKKSVEIKVRGGEPIKKDLYYSHHGWVVDYPPNMSQGYYAHSVRIAVCDRNGDRMAPLKFVEQNLRVSWSKSIFELYNNSRDQYYGHRSFIAADTKDNVLYFWGGRVPIRGSDTNSKHTYYYGSPVYGWNKWTEWIDGFWSLAGTQFQLPNYLNPRGGVIHSANNAPWHAVGCDQFARRPDWIPPHVVPLDTADTSRGQLLQESLCGKRNKKSLEDIKRMAFNTLCPDARDFLSAINNGRIEYSEIITQMGFNNDAMELDRILSDWNFHADIDQPGMTVMVNFKRITSLPWFEADYLPSPVEMETYYHELEMVAASMQKRYGKLVVPWGDIHIMVRGGKEVPLPGGTAMVQSLMLAHMKTVWDPEHEVYRDTMYGDVSSERETNYVGKFLCNFGSSFIHAHSMQDGEPVVMFITPQGQTMGPFFPDSKHIMQQTELFSKKEWIEMSLDKKSVQAIACPWGREKGHEHPATTTLKY